MAVSEAELLSPEQAFKPTLGWLDTKTLSVSVEIAEGYYLYKDRFQFTVEGGATKLIPQFPTGKVKEDPYFGKVETYRHLVEIKLGAESELPAGGVLSLKLQGCADAGVCYPPQTIKLNWQAGASKVGSTVAKAPALVLTGKGQESAPDQLFRQGNLLALLGFFFAAGVGLAFTACMYPLIPIVSGIIVGQGKAVSKLKGFSLSFVYVQGMAITYAAAGVIAALSGSMLSSALQQPWVLLAFSLFFVAMALSMFGLYDLQLPSALQSRLNDTSNRFSGGKWLSVLFMGALSALIIGPCVAPPLAAALGYIGASRDVVRGGLALYVMALGLGLPLLVVGVLGGHALPRAGAWMTSVKNVFGAIMLVVAIWIAQPVLPGWLSMLAWAGLAIAAGVYLKALDSLPPQASGWRRLWKAAGVMSLVVGLALVVGLLAGSRDPLQPLKVLGGGGMVKPEAELHFQPIRSVAELDAAIAGSAGKPVMLDFYADWCVSCKEMERFTFTDPKVIAALRPAVLLKADVTANSDGDKALLARFGLFGPPGTLFYDKAGQLQSKRVIGFEEPEAFLTSLRAAGL